MRWIPLLLAATLCFGAPQKKAPEPDKIHLSLSFSRRNGLAFPSVGGVGLVSMPLLGGGALASSLGGIKNLGSVLNDLFSGKESRTPKTEGEMARMMTSPEGDQLVAMASRLPLSCSSNGQIEADLVWDPNEQAYVVASGTLVWSGRNNSRFQAGDHLLYCNVSGGGTHRLKRDEVKVKFPKGDLSKAVAGKKGKDEVPTYDLVIKAEVKEEPLIGEGGWIAGDAYQAKEKYTTGGTQTDIKAIGGGDSLNGPPTMFALPVSYSAEEREIKDGKAEFAETWTSPGGTQESIRWSFHQDPLEAVPKVQGTVERGDKVKLDGAASRGRIRDYVWTFKPLGAGDEAPDPAAEKKGASAEVVLLDSMEITLTVSNGQRSHKKSVQVTVTPRKALKTPFETAAEGVQSDSLRPTYERIDAPKPGDPPSFEMRLEGGENICAIDPPSGDEPMHILHPDPEKAAANEQYLLAQVADPGGPWDGFSYLREWKLKIKRQSRLNKYILPDGPPSYTGMKNFYQANLEHGHDVAGYLAAVRKHEQIHSDRMESSLKAQDPGEQAEKSYGKDESRLRERLDRKIKEAAKRIHDATRDPLNPEQWHGTLVVPDFRHYTWHPGVFYVGGPNHIDFK